MSVICIIYMIDEDNNIHWSQST